MLAENKACNGYNLVAEKATTWLEKSLHKPKTDHRVQ
jgi:hypothetical protein